MNKRGIIVICFIMMRLSSGFVSALLFPGQFTGMAVSDCYPKQEWNFDDYSGGVNVTYVGGKIGKVASLDEKWRY